MSFFDQLMTAIKYMALIGILAHVIGEALPRRWFHWERFPYRAFAFENGRIICRTRASIRKKPSPSR